MALDSLLTKTQPLLSDSLSIKESLAQKAEQLAAIDFGEVMTTLINQGTRVILNIIIALVVYYVGRWIIKRVVKIIDKICEKKSVEISLKKFLLNLSRAVMYVLLVTVIIGLIGLDMTSFIAIFASAGLAVGMALSGTLQNFAGGVMILAFRPFKVGDFIEAQGQSGTVKEISLFCTIINTLDNKTIIVPNGGLSTGIVNNYSKEPIRRVDLTVSISYGDDYQLARSVIMELIQSDSRIKQTPAPFIGLSTLNQSSVDIAVLLWVDAADYAGVKFSMNERIYKTLPERGLNFPYPHLDVNILNK
ncbi:MAG: mechanosensitive ion channel [Rikenellaceae bacterium]|nr:mechanosensitive ion channel [Rikenellaceae bacterium]